MFAYNGSIILRVKVLFLSLCNGFFYAVRSATYFFASAFLTYLFMTRFIAEHNIDKAMILVRVATIW